MLIDSHCHLNFPEIKSQLDDVVARARDAGVGHMVSICTKLSEFDEVLAIAEAHDDISCTVGTHPHEAEEEADVQTAAIVARAAHPKVIGIGETGLDYFYENSPREIQKTVFRANLAAARETGLPVIVHTREADQDTADILRNEAGKGNLHGVIHCFTSGPIVAEAALEIGFYISLSGILTFKSAQSIRDIVKDIPLDRLLVETDSPFLAPVPKRGKTNEPALVNHVADMLAEVKGVSADEIRQITGENFCRLFAKAQVGV